jgi:hypothetical protein
MVVMLVGYQDGVDRGGLYIASGETLKGVAQSKAQSARMRVPSTSTNRPLPSLPLPSDAKRITSDQLSATSEAGFIISRPLADCRRLTAVHFSCS